MSRPCEYPGCEQEFSDVPQAKYCPPHRKLVKTRAHDARAKERRRDGPFTGVDGEGQGEGKDHKYVLLGVGREQVTWPNGPDSITDIFRFLYDQFKPHHIYTGFFLGYDFNMWLRMLPRERAAHLLTPAGILARRPEHKGGGILFGGPSKGGIKSTALYPVEYQGWEFDYLQGKRFKLRPHVARGHKRHEWMYICDVGSYFQSSLLSVLDPAKWPDPICSEQEYAILQTGKENRAVAVLGEEMMAYNRLENEVLARLMTRYRDGLRRLNVELKPRQWFGPGQAAQAWLATVPGMGFDTPDAPNVCQIVRARGHKSPRWMEAMRASYYGGWFELIAHGHIPGQVHEYDINSAYPYVASQLPCFCQPWKYGKGQSTVPRNKKDRYVLLHAIVRGNDKYMGALPYRETDGSIKRPRYTKGWYWKHEIDAARRAGLVNDITVYEWWASEPCQHKKPLRDLAGMYQERLRVGKDTPQGKASKVVYNSAYGKLCQSAGGGGRFSNVVYASLITAGCRTMILDAIAAHPAKSAAVLMVATDGVYFNSEHPSLPIDDETLGLWGHQVKTGMTLFKPGVYWDDKARASLAAGKKEVTFKARGISAKDFSATIPQVDAAFTKWGQWMEGMPPGLEDWPTVTFKAGFAQVSVKQAVAWSHGKTAGERNGKYRNLAGRIRSNVVLRQDSWPGDKRRTDTVSRGDDGIWRSTPHDGGVHWPESLPYDGTFGVQTADINHYSTPDGPPMMFFQQMIGDSQ